jgi:type II secretory pathway component GspD/PulD (secretin)/tetratricopeptide (TPR) repeat protein
MDSMKSRTTARNWKCVALGLALVPAVVQLEARLNAAPAPFAAVRDGEAEARAMLGEARAALKAGDIAKAERLARQCQSLKVTGNFWDKDSPEAVLADVASARAKAVPDADPKTLLKMAREALAAEKFDDAQALASKASATGSGWGLFGDSPNKCLDDIQKARAKAGKAESARLMVDARKAFQAGRYDDAEAMAYRAARLHGPYGVMDLGDKPDKLLNDIASARAKVGKSTLPPAPGMAKEKTATPAPDWGDVRPAVASGERGGEIRQTSATGTAAGRQAAMKLMAEGKAAQQAGDMVAARSRFLDAQRAYSGFKPDEDNPIRCLNELLAAVQKQCAQAADGTLPADKLASVRAMAVEFGLDVAAIDARMAGGAGGAAGTDAKSVGVTLLEKARIELKNGQFDVARQLAGEAHNGPYDCRADAAAVLRSIDAAESAHKSDLAIKAYEAGVAAVRDQDFVQAMAILRQIDPAVLPVQYQSKVDQMLEECKKQSTALAAVPSTEAPALATPPVAPGQLPLPPAAPAAAAPAPAAPAAGPGESLADQVKALNKVEFQRLREEGQKAQTESKKLFERGETDAALEILQDYINKVKASSLETGDIALLTRPVDQRLGTLKLLKSQKDSETRITNRKVNHDLERGRAALAEDKRRDQIRDLIKQHDQARKEGKVREAAMFAAKAKELDPEDPALVALDKIAQTGLSANTYETAKNNNAKMFEEGLNRAIDSGKYVDTHNPISVDPTVLKFAHDRGKGIDPVLKNRSEAEKEIQHKLSTTVDLNFSNAPLHQVIDDLRAMTGINVVPDVTALEEERISLDTPITVRLDKIKLESGLKVMLGGVHLTYSIADDVLKITTPRKARGTLVQKVYRVADLVMPVEDFQQPQAMNLERSLNRVIEQQQMRLGNGQTPFNNGRFMLPNGEAAGSSPSLTTAPGGGQPGSNTGMSQIGAPTTTKSTMHEMLIRLIQNTVAPTTWAEVGGAGTLEYMPIGMALVINQTPDVQEQVADLLEALRRLQDLQVAVEIKLITLSETFFERIGLDFNLNIKTDHSTGRYEPQLVTNQFKPAGQVNDFSPNRFIAGLNPAGSQGAPGSFTSDLDIPIRSSSFQYSIPPFAYPNNPGFDGGLSLGLAFLSDIQVYMFMEAAQGDRRIHVMQAPKLTLFNGQSASISVQDQQFFVTNVGVVGFGGQIVFTPQNNPFPLGVEMTLQAVCSADRRYVRINTNVRLANLASTNVPLFPVTTFITPVFEGGAQGQPIPFTQFIQQPQLSLVNIQTTVSIPDGGTVILGGLKTLSEGRNEFGPPVLSKVPYVNRLFRNTGFGREAQSLLVMVTPRIIINSEEEERQTGVRSVQEQ